MSLKEPGGVVAAGLVKRFDEAPTLGPVSMTAAPGELTLVTGDNGAGKTTLLRILATSVLPDAGSATVGGFDVVSQGAQVRARMGMALVNERSLFWRLTARRNLELFARMRGLGQAQRRSEVDALLAELGLATHADKPVELLSSGQRQRVVLARALLGEPDVLLIDEPLRGLDHTATEQVLSVLTSRATAGAAVVVAAPEAEALAGVASHHVALSPQPAEPQPEPTA